MHHPTWVRTTGAARKVWSWSAMLHSIPIRPAYSLPMLDAILDQAVGRHRQFIGDPMKASAFRAAAPTSQTKQDYEGRQWQYHCYRAS
jgi:hypothetical protein